MRLELFTMEDFMSEMLGGGINNIFYFYEEYEKDITFSGLLGSLVVFFRNTSCLTTEERDRKIAEIKKRYTALNFKFGRFTS